MSLNRRRVQNVPDSGSVPAGEEDAPTVSGAGYEVLRYVPLMAGALLVACGFVLQHAGPEESALGGRRITRSLASDTTIESGYPVADPHLCGDEDTRAFAVLRWAEGRGAKVHRNLSFGHFPIPGGGSVRGMKASGVIKVNETFLVIPPSVMISARDLLLHPWLEPIFRDNPLKHGSIGGLAVLLIAEAINASSRLRPYLCSLPEKVPLPVFYTSEEYAAARAGLPVKQQAKFDLMVEARRTIIDQQFTKVMLKLMVQYPHLFDPSVFSYDRFAWGVSVVMSRSWGRDMLDASNKTTTVHTLGPAVDMPNHDPRAYTAGRRSDRGISLTSSENVEKGDQIFISYGPKCDAEFLAHYGFKPAGNSAVECKRTKRENAHGLLDANGLLEAPAGPDEGLEKRLKRRIALRRNLPRVLATLREKSTAATLGTLREKSTAATLGALANRSADVLTGVT